MNKYKIFIPHISIICFFILLFIFMVLTNNKQIAYFFGGLGAVSKDPIILTFSLITGLFNFNRYRKFIILIILVSIIMLPIIHYIVLEWHNIIGLEQSLNEKIRINIIRISSLIIISHMINIPVKLIFNKKNI